jgi:hypothetical protein
MNDDKVIIGTYGRATEALDPISATMTYVMWCEEHLWNVSVNVSKYTLFQSSVFLSSKYYPCTLFSDTKARILIGEKVRRRYYLGHT